MNVQKIAAFSRELEGQLTGGNPAGVAIVDEFPTKQEMIDLAAEVGYSETVFAKPSNQAGSAYSVRYFSPEGEVPFCGHATIALGAALPATHQHFDLSLNHAEISIDVRRVGEHTKVILQSPSTSHQLVPQPDQSDTQTSATKLLYNIIELFNLSPSDIDFDNIPPAIINGGSKHLVLNLKNRASLLNMSYDFEPVKQLMLEHELVTILLTYIKDNKNLVFEVRNAFASGGVVEDPATGAAAAAFVGYLRDADLLPLSEVTEEGELAALTKVTLYQGEQMGAPSLIEAQVSNIKGSPIAIEGFTRGL